MSAVPGGAQGLLWFTWRPERLRWWFTIGIYQRTTAQWDPCHLLSEFKPSSALRLLGLDRGAFLSSLSYRGVHFASSQAPPNSRSVFLSLSCSPPATTEHPAPIMPCGCPARRLQVATEPHGGNSQGLGDIPLLWEKRESILFSCNKRTPSQDPSSLPKLINKFTRTAQTLPLKPTCLLPFCSLLRRENNLPRGFWTAMQKCLLN